MSDIILSIVTPTFNRAHLLDQCFESLRKQTVNNFEWIIVDDGSSDNTKSVVKKFIKANIDMNIQYIYKNNGGKHTAMNASHPYIRGKYVLILDSDDYLTPDATEKVLRGWNEFQTNLSIGMLIFLRGDSMGNPRAYGANDKVVGDFRELQRISITSSDCCEVFRADLFIRYPYSEYKGERFLSESELWNRLAENHYKTVYINQVIYICEYLQGGLTDSGRRMRIMNPLGGMCTSKHFFDKIYPLKIRIKKGLLYVCYGYFADMKWMEVLTRDTGHLGLKMLCLLPGHLMYWIWKKKYQP